MPHKIKLAPSPYSGLAPRSARRSLVKIVLCFALAVGAVVGLFGLQRHWQQVREQSWLSAPGTILEVQPAALSSHGPIYQPEDHYQVKVLVSVVIGGTHQKRWITLRRSPASLPEIALDAYRWKGSVCTVRWNPANDSQADVEIL